MYYFVFKIFIEMMLSKQVVLLFACFTQYYS